MLRKMRKLLGQSTLEYAVLIVIIALALLGTQSYIKRGLQGRLRQSADDMGDQFSAQTANLFTKTDVGGGKTEETVIGGITKSNMTTSEITTRVTNAYIGGNIDKDYVGK